MHTSWRNLLDQTIDDAVPQLVALRRHLHMHPEPSGCEYSTTSHLIELLEGRGLHLHRGLDGRGLIVEPQDAHDKPIVALRADIDALKMDDAKSVPYCSKIPGVMHACGHDAHTAAVFGALLALERMTGQGFFPDAVSWRVIFQPAEETSVGAQEMIEAGALARVKAIFSLHMDPSRRLGHIGVRVGPLTAACDDLSIEILGRGGHAARPHESIDPIAASAQLINTMYLFVQRGADSHDPVVVTFGRIYGGESDNVIPNKVFLGGTVRTLGEISRRRTHAHIEQLARGVAEATGTKIEVKLVDGPPAVVNDREMTHYLRLAGGEVLGSEQVEEIARPSMGGEDFSHYLQHVPGSMFRLGCTRQPHAPQLHSTLFDIEEEALPIGAKILSRAALLWAIGDQ